ncbi:MAG TPA: hypothetical protein VFO60_09400 [Candidatus Dormibacteraeota bacterium]|nr:hypothetical protein [Candidatus Dormibacteraeota bacterium]
MGLLALWALTGVAGAACAGLVGVPLRLEERAAIAAVAGIVGSSLATLLLGLVAGLSEGTAVAGPAVLLLLAVVAGRVLPAPDPVAAWNESLADMRSRLHQRETLVLLALTVIAAVGFWRLFAHALFVADDGSIKAGYATVWADWSLHSTLASSFARAGNLPPHDPIFSGGTLRYPFLPDFHAATLEAVGGSLEVSLAVPCAVLCTASTLLVVSLGRRLAGNLAVGILAMLLCLAGGSLGWSAVWWDACSASGHAQSDCSPGSALVHPATAIDAFRAVPRVVAGQDRNYDNLQNSPDAQIVSSAPIQWYTPMLAWWLPQRTFVYGFGVGAAVLLLAVAGMRAPPRTRSPFLAAGLLAGTLPLVHIHTLIALAIVLGLWALIRRRSEWLWLGGAAAVLALPRLLQVAGAGTGVADPSCPAQGTRFPTFEVGWMSQPQPDSCTRPGMSDLTLSGAATAAGRLVALPFNASFWAFWLDNNGAVLVVSVVLGVAALVASATAVLGGPRRIAVAVRDTVPAELVRLCLPFLAVFLVANVVVFQTWDWDNTKILAWWYLGGSLLTGAWIVAWWRRGAWRAVVASAVLLSLVLSAGLSLTRILQQEGAMQGGGPYVWASPTDIALAREVAVQTDGHAVVLTPAGDPTDAVLTLDGRPAYLGYEGWLNSYGVDTGMRPADRDAVYAGCQQDGSACQIPRILRDHGIDLVVVPLGSPARGWFSATYPAIAQSQSATVYDVRPR